MKEGQIIVIVAPSGSGKSTLIKRLKKDFPELIESVSYTTRPIRQGEVHGQSYFFVTEEEFLAKRDRGEFLEWAQVHANFYGTSKSFVESEIAKGHHLLFDLDVQGTDAFKDYFKNRATAIFIAPPSIEELKNRLRGRGTESTGIINIRLENSKREILRKNDFDYCVTNDELETAYAELSGIVTRLVRE